MAVDIEQAKQRIAYCYRGFRTTVSLEEELKAIKRLNVVFVKLEKTDKDIHAHEIVNILKTMNNRLDVGGIRLLLYEMTDMKYHTTIDYVIDSLSYDGDL